MPTCIDMPPRNTFHELARFHVPSPFAHDLIHGSHVEVGSVGHRTRNDINFQDRLARIVGYLGEGHPIFLGDYPHGVYRRLLLLTSSGSGIGGCGDPRGIIALAERFEGSRPQTFFEMPHISLVFFPAPQHVANYLRAGDLSMRGGPADTFLGSVGVLTLLYDREKNIAQLARLQSSINVSNPKARELLQRGERNLSSIYFKWRFQLLDLAFDFIQNVGITRISVGPDRDESSAFRSSRINPCIIIEKADKRGFRPTGESTSRTGTPQLPNYLKAIP